MPAVQAMTGRIDASETRRFAEVKKGFTSFSEGDLLFAKITPSMENGKVAVARNLVGGRGFGSTEFHVARPLAGMSTEYVMFFMLQQEVRHEAKANMTGTAGQRRVPTDYFSSIPFPIPPLAEQGRIIEEIEKQFTRLDAAVEALRTAQAKLKRYRASVLNATVTGRLVPTEAELARAEGRDYEHASILLERIARERAKQERAQPRRKHPAPTPVDTANLPELPEGWVWTTLDHLATTIRNGYSKRPQGFTGTAILRISAVRPLAVDLNDIRWVDNADNLSDFLIHAGDLLFTRYNGNSALVGVCGVVPTLERNTLHPDKLIRVKLMSAMTIPNLIGIVANAGFSRRFLSGRIRTTAGQSGISGTDLKSMPIPLPPTAEQYRIVAEVEQQLSVVQQAEAAIETNLRRAERLRQAILKRAFEGRLVPQDPDDEPAAVLLERIKTEKAGKEQEKRRRKGNQKHLVLTSE